MAPADSKWPALPLREWQPTYRNLHLWTQVIGKIRTKLVPRINHWWNSTLFLTGRGLTTLAMPYRDGGFEIRFDFLTHRLVIDTSWGASRGGPSPPSTGCPTRIRSLSAARCCPV